MRRMTPFLGAIALAALTTLALVRAAAHPEENLANGSGAVLALEALVAALFVGAILAVRTQRAWVLLLAGGVAFSAQALPLPDAGGALLFTLALVLGGSAAALAGWSAIELDVRSWPALRVVAVGTAAVCAIWAGLVPTLVFDPNASGCYACPTNLALLEGSGHVRAQSLHSGLRVAAVASIVFAVLLLGAAAGRGARHWSQRAALVAAAAALGASAFAFWHEAAASFATTDTLVRRAWVVECAALAVLAASPLAEAVRARVERVRIVDTVLRTVPSAEALRAALAAGSGDHALALEYPHAGGSVDGDGRPVLPSTNGSIVTEVVREGEVVAQLRHAELGGQAGRRLTDSVRAAGLALEHTSARARLRAQLADLTASRARIVEIADGERRRLERNLHDGAQQRLIALSVALAASGDPTASEARGVVLAALDDLRALAHGIHPVSLSDGGIVASVRELADTAGVPLRLELRRLERLPQHVEVAAYRVVAECVHAAERHGNGKPVVVGLEMTDTGLDAELVLPGVSRERAEHELAHATDRVTAVGGRIEVFGRGDGAVVELSL